MLKAILFDMDDTLIDWSGRSQEWADFDRYHLARVFEQVRQTTFPLHDFELFCQTVWSLTVKEWTAAKTSLKAPHLGQVLVEACVQLGAPAAQLMADDLLEAYSWEPFPGVVPFQDSLEVLPTLARHGLKLGLVTNAYQPIRMRDRELQAFGLLDYLPDCRVSAADVGHLKPHRAIFESALAQLGVSADEALFVGDSLEADILGAQQAGMRAIHRCTQHQQVLFAPAPSCATPPIVPDAEISTLYDLYPILDDWYPGWRA
jgi:putative hydrolase of the HAD superfamily